MLLNDLLIKRKHHVLWNTEFISSEQQNQQVIVQVKTNNTNEAITINAKYLMAFDGAKSKVRHLLKCSFEGATYEDNFFVADTHIKWMQSPDKVTAAPSNTNFCIIFPMYGGNNYFVLGTIPEKLEKKKDVTFKDLETIVKSTTLIPMEFEKVNWFSTYQMHCRCADRFKTGRCFLAGDAAYIYSPAGRQAMNTGL